MEYIVVAWFCVVWHSLTVIVPRTRVYGMTRDAIMEQPNSCTDSLDCPLDFCCRDKHGKLIDYSGSFDSIGPLRRQKGNCSQVKAQRREICSQFCPCESGLRCFRHLRSQYLEHFTCQDQYFVETEIDNFFICFNDSNCRLPI